MKIFTKKLIFFISLIASIFFWYIFDSFVMWKLNWFYLLGTWDKWERGFFSICMIAGISLMTWLFYSILDDFLN